jgi:hypothetical protein
MKYKKTSHWTDKPNQIGLLFFAQILDESLFDYTLDSFKPQALNSRLLCIELLQTIDSVKAGTIKSPSLKPLLEEFLWTFGRDLAVKEILGKYFERFSDRIKNNENNVNELKATILHIYHHLDNKKYLNKIQSILINLVPANSEKENIYRLTRTYLTELINYGYNPGHIYYKANQYFFNKKNTVNENSPKQFFELFDFKKTSFKVIYRVKSIFKEFDSISKFGEFTIQNQIIIPDIKGQEKIFIDSKPADEVFIVFEKIETTDEITARYISEMPLARISNLFSFYHHKEKPKINDKALVININDNSHLLIEKPLKSIIKKEDIKPKIAASKVKALFGTLDMPERELYTLLKAIDIHSIALETDEIENKLLNLWTAIETLIPKDSECGYDRIIQILKGIVPFQTVDLLKNLINQTAADFFFFNKRLASNTLKGVKLNTPELRWYRVCALIVTKENEPNRASVYAKLEDYPLLRWRIFWLNKQFASAKTTKKFIDNHIQRVEWQIQRIYRVRNLIVHSGTIPSYANILVENLHNYFDDLVNYIIDTAISESTIKSIKEGIVSGDIHLKESLKTLDKLGESEITLENYKQII